MLSRTRIFFTAFFFLFSCFDGLFAQVISIAAARTQSVGSVVTVSGIVTNGSELGTIRYMEDGTAGLAVFDAQLSGVMRGDYITVTGVLASYFNLLELNPVTSLTVVSSGNSLPVPVLLTPSQMGETYESQLMKIDNVIFTGGGGIFSGNTNYTFTSNGQTGVLRVQGSGTIAGQPIPTAAVSVTGLCSQYQSTYQLIPRDANDLAVTGAMFIIGQPYPTNITTSGLTVNWETNIPGSTLLMYGLTPLFELGTLTGAGGNVFHTVNITGASPSQVYYVKALSVSGTDTAFSSVKIFITASGSSGIMKCYFNRPVNHSVAQPATNLAVQLGNTIDDTLAAYINRTQLTLDIAIYNFTDNGTGAIIQAINDAYSRGVNIRIIADGNNSNSALPLLNPAIPILNSPVSNGYYNIMHNKFVVMDAGAANVELPVVWSGSTNWTNQQLFSDANNVIIIRDKSLAKAYTMEFEEMWGGSGGLPNPANSKFGPDKTDNTPHEFNIGGRRVESYFSPSDNVNNMIMNAIETADSELYFALLVFTRFDLAYAIADRVTSHGVYAAGMVDNSANGGQTVFSILQNVIGNRMMEYNHLTFPGILHHKYMIVDQGDAASDPLVLTGSHNWSTSAAARNDENTLVVHDVLIANQYYQEFYQMFSDNGGGTLGISNAQGTMAETDLFPNPSTGNITVSMNPDFDGTAAFLISDLQGRLLNRIEKNIRHGENRLSFNFNLNNGIYFFRIMYDGKTVTRKLVIH